MQLDKDKSDKRSQLLAIAERLFATQGFDAVSIRDLAREANMNIAMVSYYFGSKEKLFEEIIESKKPFMREKLLQLKNNTNISAWEKIAQTIDLYTDIVFKSRYFNQIIHREITSQQRPALANLLLEYVQTNFGIIEDFIKEGQGKGVFRYIDVELTIMTIMSVINTTVNNSRLCGKLLHEEPEEIFSDRNKQRVNQHLKSLLQSHLFIRPV